jgi:hypothetical protein
MSGRSGPTEVEVKRLWEAALAPMPSAAPRAEKGLAFRRNFQFNLKKAVEAGARSVDLEQTLTHPHPHDATWILHAAYQSVMTVWGVMASLCEAMGPTTYVVAVTLSKAKDGLSEDELKKQVEAFLTNPQETKFAWFYGMTPALADRARRGMTPDGKWLATALKEISDEGWITKTDDGKLKCEPKSFKVGWGD